MYNMVYMNTKTATILNFKTDKKLKADAKKVAEEIGVPLGTVMNSFLKQFVRDKEITLSANEYRPMKFLQDAIAESEREFEAGGVTIFENVDDMIADLMSKK